jgi:hypothetical protein
LIHCVWLAKSRTHWAGSRPSPEFVVCVHSTAPFIVDHVA